MAFHYVPYFPQKFRAPPLCRSDLLFVSRATQKSGVLALSSLVGDLLDRLSIAERAFLLRGFVPLDLWYSVRGTVSGPKSFAGRSSITPNGKRTAESDYSR